MPGVHRLEHVEDLGTADLADDDAVRPHPQRVAHEVPNRYAPTAFDVRRSRLERNDMLSLQTQLGGIFDRDDPLDRFDVGRERAEERGLPGARSTGNDDRATRAHRIDQDLRLIVR